MLLLIGAGILTILFYQPGILSRDGDHQIGRGYRSLDPQRDLENKHDIERLATGVEAFHREFHLGKEFFPSRLMLCERYADYFDNKGNIKGRLHADSLAFLQRVWPRLWTTSHAVVVDWNGNGQIDGPALLEGDQCLVFFLGGIPNNQGEGQPNCQGFSSDPRNPAAAGGPRKGPYCEFKSSRLVKVHKDNLFYSYLDMYKKQPYAYFSSYKDRNGYNRYFSLLKNSDCATLGVWPYAESFSTDGVKYQSPAKFQIISAGEDQTFGLGTDLGLLQKKPPQTPITWTPETAADLIGPGRDDRSNFHDKPLGTR
jgi:hypothetical protein